MQGVRFVNLDYLRPLNPFTAVVCTPGSLSAYRRTPCLPHLTACGVKTFWDALPPQRRPGPDQFYPAGRPLQPTISEPAWIYPGPRDLPSVCRCTRWERGNLSGIPGSIRLPLYPYGRKYRLLPIVEFFLPSWNTHDPALLWVARLRIESVSIP